MLLCFVFVEWKGIYIKNWHRIFLIENRMGIRHSLVIGDVSIFFLIKSVQPLLLRRRDGRAVECGGLENR